MLVGKINILLDVELMKYIGHGEIAEILKNSERIFKMIMKYKVEE